MKEYRAKLKIDTLITAISAVILAAVSALATANEIGLVDLFSPMAGDSHWHSRWNGFVTGASAGLLILMVLILVRNLKAMKDEKALKKLFIKDNDERTAEIYKSAQAAAYRTVLLVGLVAVIVAGYFNVTVSLTILVSIMIAAVIGILYKVYFSRKF